MAATRAAGGWYRPLIDSVVKSAGTVAERKILMNDWLIANLGITLEQFGVFLGLLGSFLLNLYLIKDRLSAKTIALKDATIKQLEVSLAVAVAETGKKEKEKKKAENDIESLRSLLGASQSDNRVLHDKISSLEKRIAAMSSDSIPFAPKSWRDEFNL